MSNLYPQPVKIDSPVSVDRSKSRAILRWLNHQQSLENLQAKLASLKEEVKAYEKAIVERTLQVAEIEREFFLGEDNESEAGLDSNVADGKEQP